VYPVGSVKTGDTKPALLTVRDASTPQVKRTVPEPPERTAATLGVRVVQVVARDADGVTLNVGSMPETTTSKARRGKTTLYLRGKERGMVKSLTETTRLRNLREPIRLTA
jgi:hypothetical protein